MLTWCLHNYLKRAALFTRNTYLLESVTVPNVPKTNKAVLIAKGVYIARHRSEILLDIMLHGGVGQSP